MNCFKLVIKSEQSSKPTISLTSGEDYIHAIYLNNKTHIKTSCHSNGEFLVSKG